MSQKTHPEFTNLHEFEKFLCRISREQSIIPVSMWKEYIGIFSEDGQLSEWFCEEIDPDTLSLSKTLSQERENECRGKIVSHNHPSGASFSFNDIITWADLKQLELRVITWGIYGCLLHSITPKNGIWPAVEDIQREYEKSGVIDSVGNLQPWLKPDDFMEKLATRGLFIYTKEPFPAND